MIEPIWLFLIGIVVLVFIIAALFALVRGGSDRHDNDPYNGDGF